MSDPTDPTRPVRPVGEPRQPHVRETVAGPDPVREEMLHDSLRSLRTALVLVGVLAVAALGVAVYALIQANDAKDTSNGSNDQAASAARVSALDDRVDQLRADVYDKASKSSVSQLRSDVDQLQQDVSKAKTQDPTQEIDQLKQDVDDLNKRVDDLEKPFLSFLNVRYAVVPRGYPLPRGWKRVAVDSGGELLENERVLPRVFVPESVCWEAYAPNHLAWLERIAPR